MAITLLIKMIIGSTLAVGSTATTLGIVYKKEVKKWFADTPIEDCVPEGNASVHDGYVEVDGTQVSEKDADSTSDESSLPVEVIPGSDESPELKAVVLTPEIPTTDTAPDTTEEAVRTLVGTKISGSEVEELQFSSRAVSADQSASPLTKTKESPLPSETAKQPVLDGEQYN